jgi:hypothetical protein
MFVAQDNDDNFKFARWDAIDTAFGGSLTSDTHWDPRLVGLPPPPNPVGDFNRDHAVAASDYVLWRNTLGATGLTPYTGADGDGDGTIDQDDYRVWRAHVGEARPAVGNGAAASAVRQAASEGETALLAGAETTVTSGNPIRNAALHARLELFGDLDTPRAKVFPPRVRMSTCGIVEPGVRHLLQLAIDRLRLPEREAVFVVEDRRQADRNAGRAVPTDSAGCAFCQAATVEALAGPRAASFSVKQLAESGAAPGSTGELVTGIKSAC